MEFYNDKSKKFIDWLKIVLKDTLIYKNGSWILKKNDSIFHFDKKNELWIQDKQGKTPIIQQELLQNQDHDDDAFKLKYIKNKIVYGFLEDNKFKIRDVSNSENWTNKKTTTSGKNCSSYDFDKLIYFLYSIDPKIPLESEIIDNESFLNIHKKLINKDIEILKKEAFSIISFYNEFLKTIGKTQENVAREDLLFLLYFYKSYYNKKNLFCQYLLQVFKKNNLLTKPPLKKITEKTEPKKKGRKKKELIISKQS
jgi:hypothetical protein